MDQLPIFLNLAGRPVILLGDGDMADAKRRLIERAGGHAVDEDDGQARIAIVALEDDEAALAAVARLKARGLIVNAVDRPELCDYTTPAIIDRDPVLIAIGTGGASAGLAKALRQRLEALLPQGLGRLATRLADARDAMRSRWPTGPDRRRAIDAALAPAGPLDPLAEQAEDAVDVWLSGGGQGAQTGLYDIQLLSDDPEDLTLRQVRLLGNADRILHDPAIPAAVLARARADAMVAELGSEPVTAEAAEIVIILRRAKAGSS